MVVGVFRRHPRRDSVCLFATCTLLDASEPARHGLLRQTFVLADREAGELEDGYLVIERNLRGSVERVRYCAAHDEALDLKAQSFAADCAIVPALHALLAEIP